MSRPVQVRGEEIIDDAVLSAHAKNFTNNIYQVMDREAYFAVQNDREYYPEGEGIPKWNKTPCDDPDRDYCVYHSWADVFDEVRLGFPCGHSFHLCCLKTERKWNICDAVCPMGCRTRGNHYIWKVNKILEESIGENCKHCLTAILPKDHAVQSKCGHFMHRFCYAQFTEFEHEVDKGYGVMLDRYDVPGCFLCEIANPSRCFCCRKEFTPFDHKVEGTYPVFATHAHCMGQMFTGGTNFDNHHTYFLNKYAPAYRVDLTQ